MGFLDKLKNRRLTNFNFEADAAHVALVDKAANGQEVLVIKSVDVKEEEVEPVVVTDSVIKQEGDEPLDKPEAVVEEAQADETAELLKSLQDEVAQLRKEKAEREHSAMLDTLKSLDIVKGKEEGVLDILKSLSLEHQTSLLDILAGAQGVVDVNKSIEPVVPAIDEDMIKSLSKEGSDEVTDISLTQLIEQKLKNTK